ncbi:MAG: GTP-binding protein [Pseudomonadota bacterium]
MDTQDSRIPVTLLTGFLGAGKTTLLNHLINDPQAGRIAVIMNEFGAAGLDHDLIEASTEETILMQSGCLCCTFRGDIAKTLGKLMARKQSGELSFDRIKRLASQNLHPSFTLWLLTSLCRTTTAWMGS